MREYVDQMNVDAGMVAASFGDAWSALAASGAAGTWSRTASGATAMVTGLPVASLNGVWVHGDAVEPEDVRMLLDEVSARDVPFCLQLRPRHVDAIADIVAERGMAAAPAVPLMALDGDASLDRSRVAGLEIRPLATAEFGLHSTVAAAGFGAPLEVFETLMGMVQGLPGLRIYVGEVGGVPVTTALTFPTLGDAVGVFNVATPPEHRTHGYGAAVTAHAVREALSVGARWAWLQSSSEGFRVYEGLGFRTVEDWSAFHSSAGE